MHPQVQEAFGLAATARLVACACSRGTVRLFSSKTLAFRANLPYWTKPGQGAQLLLLLGLQECLTCTPNRAQCMPPCLHQGGVCLLTKHAHVDSTGGQHVTQQLFTHTGVDGMLHNHNIDRIRVDISANQTPMMAAWHTHTCCPVCCCRWHCRQQVLC